MSSVIAPWSDHFTLDLSHDHGRQSWNANLVHKETTLAQAMSPGISWQHADYGLIFSGHGHRSWAIL